MVSGLDDAIVIISFKLSGMSKMRILFYLGHPAHYHLFRSIIETLKNRSHEVLVTVKKKDVLEELLEKDEQEYINIFPKERGNGKISIALSLLKKDFSLYKIARKFNPLVMIGTSAEITHVGRLLRIYSIVVNEDDHDVVPFFSKLAYPFGDCILAPSSCRVGRWAHKCISYEGYHELAYLHPRIFIPNKEVVFGFNPKREKYFILRFAKLSAHHDSGKSGINDEIADKIIEILGPHGRIYISSEKELSPDFEKYRINIAPDYIHHALFFADLYIGDSQTMAAEAAVLGTPSLRFNDFVGRISYLEELEHKYSLTFGFKTTEPLKLFKKIEELIHIQNIKAMWQKRREKMLSEKIDVTAFMTWFIENYQESANIMKENPEYQYRFI